MLGADDGPLKDQAQVLGDVLEALVEHLHHRELDVEADQVAQRERTDRMVRPELHRLVDLLGERLRRSDMVFLYRRKAAIILPPPRLSDLVSVTGTGERMPQKSTFFFPKLLGGLVYHRHDD